MLPRLKIPTTSKQAGVILLNSLHSATLHIDINISKGYRTCPLYNAYNNFSPYPSGVI